MEEVKRNLSEADAILIDSPTCGSALVVIPGGSSVGSIDVEDKPFHVFEMDTQVSISVVSGFVEEFIVSGSGIA